MKVAVIDDSDQVLAHTARCMGEAGIIVVTITSPLGAALIIGREKPDLVLVDTDMPALSGETAVAILKRQRHLKAKIVLYSDKDEQETLAAVKRCGADGWVGKTADGAALVASVKRVLGVT